MNASDDIKPCPFCGQALEEFGHDTVFGRVCELFRHPYSDTNCPLAILVFTKEQWNARAVVDATLDSPDLTLIKTDQAKYREISRLIDEFSQTGLSYQEQVGWITGVGALLAERNNRIKRLEVQLSKLLVLIDTHGDRIMKAHASLLMRAREVLHAGRTSHPEETWDGCSLE